jgi:hypothetical protein
VPTTLPSRVPRRGMVSPPPLALCLRSGQRDSNPRRLRWQHSALPLSYARLLSIVKVLLLQQLGQDSNLEPLINGQV